MLPNLKFLVCGILFCVLLFAATGAHVMLPDSRTHIGEMPEIGRPMMQRSMVELPGRAQDYMMAVARRSDELERLREPAPVEAAPEPPEPDLPNMGPPKPDLAQPDLPKPGVVATVASEDAKPENPTMDGSPREGGAASVPSPPVPFVETRSEDGTDEAGPPQQVAVMTAGAEESEPIPRFVNVPLPSPRPTAFNGLRRQGTYSTRRPRLAQRHDIATQGPAVPSGHAPVMPGIAAGYTPSEAAGR
jgi:hypothetical protein